MTSIAELPAGFADKVLSAMRKQFGGHQEGPHEGHPDGKKS